MDRTLDWQENSVVHLVIPRSYMKVFLYQGGLHLEPELCTESEALKVLTDNLKFVDIGQDVTTGPIAGDLGNENPADGGA
jgi:hypothetical protein